MIPSLPFPPDSNRGGMEKKPLLSQGFLHFAVKGEITIGGVSHDRQFPFGTLDPELVRATGQRMQAEQA